MSKYGDALDAQDQDSARQVSASLKTASQFNPDEYAQAIDRSKELDVPAITVARDPKAFERPSKYGAALDAIDAPKTHEWLKSVDNAAVAQDDIQNLSAMEALVQRRAALTQDFDAAAKSLRRLPGNTYESFKQGIVGSMAGLRAWQQKGLEEQERGLSTYEPIKPKFDPLGKILPITPKINLEDYRSEHAARADEALQEFRIAGRVAGMANEAADAAIPNDAGFIERSIQQGVASGANALLATMAAGPEAGVLTLSGQAFGSRYGQLATMVDKGKIEQGEAVKSAALLATLEGLTEYLPGKTLVKNIPGFGKKVAEFAAAELPGEYASALGQLIDDYQLGLREDITVDDVKKTLMDVTGATIAGGATQLTVAQVIQGLAKKTNDDKDNGASADRAAQNKAAAEEVAKIAQESKLAKRSPEKLEELIAEIKKDTGAETAYVDAEAFRTLYQSDEEAAQAAAELTGDPNTYYEAAVSNTRLAIPLEKYVARIATNPKAASLVDHVTFSEEGLTAKEAEEVLKRGKDIAVEENQEPQADTSQAIFDDVSKQLQSTGMDRSTAERNAALTQSVFRTLAQRTGQDANQLYQNYGVRIQREGMEGGTTFDQDAVNKYRDAANVLRGLANSEDLFQQPKIENADTLESTIGQIEPGAKVITYEYGNDDTQMETENGNIVRQFKVEMPGKGKAGKKPYADVFELQRGKQRLTYIDVSGLTSGQNRGNAIYGAVAAWAHANDITFIADPNGLSKLGAQRRTEMMLSSALKYGTTKHISPGAAQQRPADFEYPLHPLKWSDDDAENISQLLETSHRNTLAEFPEIADMRYNFTHGKFERNEGGTWREAKPSDFSALANSARGRAAGIGEATLKRAVVIQSLVQGTPGGSEGRSFPTGLARLLRAERLDDELERLFYQTFNKEKRGAIQFGKDRKFTISLFEKADLSTFLHETGHLYLEIMGDIAASENAPQQVKDDYAAILKWMGVENRDSIDVEQHEKFARGFESYLMEGKAPSVELQNVFARFRAWLVSIYRTLRSLNVELSDDIRSVMDRLVATDDEIQAAEETQNYAPVFTTAEKAGMSEREWTAYKNIATKAHQEASQELTDRAMRELSREQQAWWKEERAKIIDEVTQEANELPVYRAWSFLRDGTEPNGDALPDGVEAFKLNKDELNQRFGEDAAKRLPKGLAKKGGASVDLAAQLFGYESGKALIDDLSNARPKKQFVEMEADKRMHAKHGDMLMDGSIAEKALEAVHTDSRAKVMAAELKALNRQRNKVKPFVNAALSAEEKADRQAREANEAALPDRDELKAIKVAVANIMAAKKVRDISPNVYRLAEAKAARKAFDAAAKGKYDEAYAEKRRQILNHELYRAAVKARDEVSSIVDYMRSFDKKATRERLAKAKGQYLEQIDALRSRFDFTNVSNIEDIKRDALAKWVADQEAAGREVNVPAYLLNEARKTPYKELMVAELQGLNDAIKNIDHLARTKDKLLKNKAAAEFQDAKAEMISRTEQALPPGKEPPLGRFELGKRDALAKKAHEIADSLLRPETIVEWLDGGTTGPWHDYLWNQANNSEDLREQLRDRVAKPLFELSQKIDRERRNELQESVNIPSMGRGINRRTLISIALNMGNASNLDKLKRGGYRTAEGATPFTDQNLAEIKDALTKEDWEFVQTIWNTVDGLWPDVVEFQKRMGGLVPEKVEAVPVQTKHGEFKGGYFPLVYDPDVSAQGEKQVASDAVQEIMGNNFTRASTKKGHTKERTKVARPILLDFERVVTRHMDQVITDISHREFVLQAMKLLDDSDIRALIQNRIGDGAYRSLQGMVRHAVRADGYYGDPAASAWMKAQDYLIRNTAVAALGFRAVTAWGNLVLAPVQASARISPKAILKGIGAFYKSPREMTESIHEASPFMKHRAENLDSSLVETMATLRGEKSIRAQVARAAMAVHRWADFLGTHGLWLGKYRDVLEAGGTPEEAQQQADKAIRQTQTAGAPKDLAAFERDPQYKAFRMFLGPMLIMGNRIRESVGRKGVVKNWPEAFGTLMATWFVPAILWELATGKGPDSDDPEDEGLWALRKIFFYPFMTVPFLRDIANVAERKISGQYAPSRSVPLAEAGELVLKAGERAAKAGSALFEGEEVETDKLLKATLRASGPLVGIPSTQLDVTGQFLYDVYTGEFDPQGVGDMKYLFVKQ